MANQTTQQEQELRTFLQEMIKNDFNRAIDIHNQFCRDVDDQDHFVAFLIYKGLDDFIKVENPTPEIMENLLREWEDYQPKDKIKTSNFFLDIQGVLEVTPEEHVINTYDIAAHVIENNLFKEYGLDDFLEQTNKIKSKPNSLKP